MFYTIANFILFFFASDLLQMKLFLPSIYNRCRWLCSNHRLNEVYSITGKLVMSEDIQLCMAARVSVMTDLKPMGDFGHLKTPEARSSHQQME